MSKAGHLRANKLGIPYGEYLKLDKVFRGLCLLKKNLRCLYCGCRLCENTLTIDHIKDIKDGGKHEYANIAPSCFQCNQNKNIGIPLTTNREYPTFDKVGKVILY